MGIFRSMWLKAGKILGTVFFLMYVNQIGLTQPRIIVSGHIYDIESNKPLPYANIYVRNSVWGSMSDTDGYYEFNLPPGEYDLVCSMIGYKTHIRKIIIFNNSNKQFNVYLSPTILSLPGVFIIGIKSPEQKQIESTSCQVLDARKIGSLPFTLNDANRALKTMPGITSNTERSSELNVRGGTSEENLVLIDGIRIYSPFHLKEVYNTSISIPNLNMIEEVNIMTGGFPAKYGDRLSSVLNIKYKNGNSTKLTNEIEIGTVRFNYLLEGPISDKSSGILSYNKSYFELPFKIIEHNSFLPKFYSISAIPKFYDFQAKLDYHFSLQNFCSFFF